MAEFKSENVNDAFEQITEAFHRGTIPVDSNMTRNGEVIRCTEPVTITYLNPEQRVLFNAGRDCNPFFHFYESMWMLAGHNDVESLSFYSSKIAKIASDDGRTFNGAYGRRWRYADRPDYWAHSGFKVSGIGAVDQIKTIVEQLRRNPDSRRAVLDMWNVQEDLMRADDQFDDFSKDVCCNLSVVFEVERGTCLSCGGDGYTFDDVENITGTCGDCHGRPNDQPRYLNITVFNRSNDTILGALGANVVHFSFLQEYVAGKLGLLVGRYHQISSNLHIYTDSWDYEKICHEHRHTNPKAYPEVFNMGSDDHEFDDDLREFVDAANCEKYLCMPSLDFAHPFFAQVAVPMYESFNLYKHGRLEEAALVALDIEAIDWQIACHEWIMRRKARREQQASS